ncbi:MAG TPA: MBG domain-containing protein, partial [Pirellulales bacterium]|nr:MBG domain-containing protein [Pirellulales bacterium]
MSAANYNFTFVNGTLTVSQAVPVLTWGVPADIIFGKALSAAQLDATANVPGTFSYTLADGTTPASGAVLQAGPNQTLRVAFTPADTVDYTAAAAQVEINVNRATLTVKANDVSRKYASSNPAFTDAISGFVNGDGPSVVSGAASLTTTANIASPVGAYPITAGLGTLNAADYDFAFQDGVLSVTLGAPVIAWNNPANLTYGQSLGVAQLNASANVPGTFTYTLADGKTPAAGAVLNAGQNQTLNVTFTPNDATDYPTATAQVQIAVDPATLTVAANDASRAYGAANPAFTDAISGFVNGDSLGVVSGAASLTTTATLSSAVGNYTISAAQGTLSAANYTFSFVSGSLAVTQVAPVVSWGAPADIIYGAALGGSQLGAIANVPGSFSYTLADGTTPAEGAVLHAGPNQTLIVTFTPTDAVDYSIATAQVVINVAPATLTVTPNDASRVYGAANPAFADTISGFVNGDSPSVVSGGASLISSASIVSAAGNYSITAALGTLNAADYVFVFESATLTVTRATPAVSWINPTDIIYGHALGGAQLDATAGVQGMFSYTLADGVTPAAGAVLNAGQNQTLIVTFTPTDTINYTTVTALVEINVAPAVLIVTASDASRGYGAANPIFADAISGFVNGEGLGVVSGAASLTTTASTNSALGDYAITAALGTLTAANYTFSFQNGTLTVAQATPVITWSNPADISYGNALGGSQLDATANVAGTFSYTLADGTTLASGVVLQAGLNQTLNVVFTPLDTTDYAAAAAQVAINVAPATLTVKANDASRIYAASNPTFTDTISGFVNGDGPSIVSGAASLSTTANIASPAGVYPITAGLGTLSAANYKFDFQDGTLNVGLAAPVLTWNKPADITYGQPLGAG